MSTTEPTNEPTTETREEKGTEPTTAQPVAESAEAAPAASAAGAGPDPDRGPIPGDVTTEPVATAAQSHVKGRVGPPSIAQDSDAPWHTPEAVTQIRPGEEADATTVVEGGPIPTEAVDPNTLGAGPYGGETPAPQAANVVTQTVPGDGPATADELPAGTPVPSSSSTGGGSRTIPPAAGGSDGGSTSAASGSSGSPTSPTESSTPSSAPGSTGATEPADSGGTTGSTGPAGTSPSDGGSAGSTSTG